MTAAGYNLDGGMRWLKYPDSRVVAFEYDAAARLHQAGMTEFNGAAVSYNYWNVPATVSGAPGFHAGGARLDVQQLDPVFL